MKKNILKIVLDIIMTVLLVLLYNSRVISLTFHEVAGLVIFGLFIIHCVFNWRWIIATSKKLFTKSLPAKVRIGYAVDLLLLISFLLIIISGIFISKVLFPSLIQINGIQWRSVHVFFSALSIVLVGVHIGLHWDFVKGMFKKIIKLPQRIAKPAGIILLILIGIFGIYNLKVSGFSGWITQSSNIFSSQGNGGFAMKPDSTGNAGGTVSRDFGNKGDFSGGHSFKNQSAGGGNIANILKTAAQYLSMLVVFGAGTYFLQKLLRRRKKVITDNLIETKI